MSGDCGHGWMYHSRGAAYPCDKCKEEYDAVKAQITELEECKTLTPALQNRLGKLKKFAENIANNW